MWDEGRSAPDTKVPVHRACKAAVEFLFDHALDIAILALPAAILSAPLAFTRYSRSFDELGWVHIGGIQALAVLGWVISSAAILRLALRPFFSPSFEALRKPVWRLLAFGADEFRIGIVAFAMGIINLGALLVAFLVAGVIALFLQSTFDIRIMPPAELVGTKLWTFFLTPGGLLGFFLLILASLPPFWLFCRFSLAYCDTLTRQKVQIVSATTYTRANAWRIGLCFIAINVIALLNALILCCVFALHLVMYRAIAGSHLPLGFMIVVVGKYIWIWLSYGLTSGLCAYLYQGLVPREAPQTAEPID